MQNFNDATPDEINATLEKSWKAFEIYSTYSLQQRAGFMHAIAAALDTVRDNLVEIAMKETHLPAARLHNEITRTIFQLNSYADACVQGNWLEVRIDTADTSRQPPKPDLRKILVPLGPVVVFGASNFPFAYSTAGGDTACAFAAGCPVIVKAHPAHAQTSEMVASIILDVARELSMPEGIFTHIHGIDFEVGKNLVMHARTQAVGFTGSYAGGKALFDWAAQRSNPIPVFAEMGSVNPVFLMPEKLSQSPEAHAVVLAASITQGTGQFCTNPGLIIGIESAALQKFIIELGKSVSQVSPSAMLHPGIAKAFATNRTAALNQQGVDTIAVAEKLPEEGQAVPTIASATGEAFLHNRLLHQEVFGPYSLVIRCKDSAEMGAVAKCIEGQLTTTLIATETDIRQNILLVETIKKCCGRIIMNGVPTGVEVSLSMQHGGPFPATTDARFTSVGADGIKRFARPLCFQNWDNSLLPDELKDDNPLGIWRTVNNTLTTAGMS